MLTLIDTNIILRFVEPRDSEYVLVRGAVEALTAEGENLCFAAQNLVEFWNVCTRPVSKNGLGLTSAQTDERASLIESRFRLLPDSERLHPEWRRLVVTHSVAGVQVHDARLVAAMVVHGVPRLLTLNDRDFSRYPGISARHPLTVVWEDDSIDNRVHATRLSTRSARS